MATKKIQFKPKATKKEGVDFTVAPIKDARTATDAVLSIVLAHTADVFRAVVDAVAEHYSLDKTEMMEVITTHPKYVGVTLNPVLADLGAFERSAEPVDPPVIAKDPMDELTAATAAMSIAASLTAPLAPKKKFVIRKPKAATPS